MTDLDRFKELLVKDERYGLSETEQREKLDIYEKLSKAEEFKNNFLEIFPWDSINSTEKLLEKK